MHKIDKPLVVYRFSGTDVHVTLWYNAHNNVPYLWKNPDVFTPKERLQKLF